MAGLLLAVLGLVGLVRGRVARLGMRNRAVAAVVAAAGMASPSLRGGSSSGAPDTLAAPPVRQGPVAANGAVEAGRVLRVDLALGARATLASGPRRATPAPVRVPRPSATPPDPGPGRSRPSLAVAQAGDRAGRPGGAAVKGRAPRPATPGSSSVRRGPTPTATAATPATTSCAATCARSCSRPARTAAWCCSGTLDDPYTGADHRVRAWAAAPPPRVQIDHVVALSDAWQKGAQQWSDARRGRAFANDPLNLLAVDGPTNQRKGDGDAATWLPPRTSYRCAYVARQTAVKARYGLWVTAAERDAVRRVLATCPGQRLPSAAASVPLGGGRTAAAAPAPVPAPQPRSTSAGRRTRLRTRPPARPAVRGRAGPPTRPATARTAPAWTRSTTGTATGTTTASCANGDRRGAASLG